MLLEVALPISLAIIMFSLGIGLTFADFARVLKLPKAVAIGLVFQIIGLPMLAYALLQIFPLPPELAFGVMLLSFCPGGVTSSMLTKLSNGAVALSITMTAIASLISVISIPLLVSIAAHSILGEAAPEIDVTQIAISMFLITAFPVLIGVLIRHFLTATAQKLEPILSVLSLLLFAVIIIAALALNWQIFVDSVAVMGPLLVLFNLIALGLGLVVARGLSLDGAHAKAIAIELGVQNGTLGIAVATIIGGSGAISAFAVPSAIYGVVMYLVSIPFLFLIRNRLA